MISMTGTTPRTHRIQGFTDESHGFDVKEIMHYKRLMIFQKALICSLTQKIKNQLLFQLIFVFPSFIASSLSLTNSVRILSIPFLVEFRK
jgi:hypothetical protein